MEKVSIFEKKPAIGMSSVRKLLLEIYNTLYNQIGPRGWWPGDSALEIIVGAILTQNTTWKNAEKAIKNLKERGVLSVEVLSKITAEELAQLIRPSGYYNQKAKKIKRFMDYLMKRYKGDIGRMAQVDVETLRKELLFINGIGPETADSILLYALDKPSFVVDSYTKRIFSRHNLLPEDAGYERVREYFMKNLPEDVSLYNEFHALIDYVGHHFCKRAPDCDNCPLRRFSPNF